jgi:23S rRNA pseudouridine2457 synthase
VSYDVRSKRVEKEYYVEVDGIITDKAIDQLKNGVDIKLQEKEYRTLPCKVNSLDQDPRFEPTTKKRHRPTSWVSITLIEGKFRQVRKMTAAVGFPTLRLVRVRIGTVWLNDMKPGDVQEWDGIFL